MQRLRILTLATTLPLVAATAVACSGGTTASTPTGGAGTTSPSTTSVAATTPAGGPVGSTAPTAANGTPYASAITDQVVANPAFAGLGRDISRRISAAGLPGASLLVLQDGKLVEQEAYGSYDLTTAVPIASASKWMTGVTIMTLVDEGRLDLDTPISTYLPTATGPSGAITLRQLLSFTSGLEYDEKIPCFQDPTVTLAQCNEQILQLPLLGRPGTGYRYTGTHLHVAAGVAEAVTGETFEQLFQERVARPLGMTHTTFVHSANPALTAPDGHPNPAGGAVSTLGDYGRFMELLVHDGVAPDGTRIISSAALAEMSKDQIADARYVSASPDRKAAQTPYGLAHWLDVTAPDGTGIVESSPGAFGFRPWIDRTNHVAGVYLILDRDDSHVADAPTRTADTRGDVQTSGRFVMAGTAEALGTTLPGRRSTADR